MLMDSFIHNEQVTSISVGSFDHVINLVSVQVSCCSNYMLL